MGLCVSVPRDSASEMDSIQPKTDKNTMISTPNGQKLEMNGDPRVDFGGIKSQVSNLNRGSSRSFGSSRDSAFHDTQPWLDSDNDDDFYSINGDFTPSRGSTPLHGIVAGNPKFKKSLSLQSNGTPFQSKPRPLNTELNPMISSPDIEPWKAPASADTTPRGKTSNMNSTLSSPSDKKKLLELFRESRAGVNIEGLTFSGLLRQDNHANATSERSPSIHVSANKAPYHSRANSVSTGVRTPNGDSVKPVKEKPHRSPLSACFLRITPSRSHCKKN
ncbi:hypothetical protein AKJ16_DCAP01328 [Drosera capensis]